MSGSFATAVRERARRAVAALEAARHGDDADELILAEAEWEHVTRLARMHGVPIGPGEAGPGERTAP
ncbi:MULTISPECIES: hypothetical protein [unclassified Streptosporangium]|uniref:hypothetical protein n=1 Tax=unclassified Streptosporangium TaxID=2632669 RepID=UPI002E2AEC55|nr:MULTISPECIES: hypothetical protein [unclassified Streptosporangium]